MTNQAKDAQLLAELSRLIGKYGPEPFERLAKLLLDQQFLEQLVSLLEISARAGRPKKKTSGTKASGVKKAVSIDDVLKGCPVDRPDVVRALDQLYQRMVKKTVLPHLQDIRLFSEDNGLPPVNAKSRQQAIAPFVRAIACAPPERIETLLAESNLLVEKDDRSLEGWANIILGSRRSVSEK